MASRHIRRCATRSADGTPRVEPWDPWVAVGNEKAGPEGPASLVVRRFGLGALLLVVAAARPVRERRQGPDQEAESARREARRVLDGVCAGCDRDATHPEERVGEAEESALSRHLGPCRIRRARAIR